MSDNRYKNAMNTACDKFMESRGFPKMTFSQVRERDIKLARRRRKERAARLAEQAAREIEEAGE